MTSYERNCAGCRYFELSDSCVHDRCNHEDNLRWMEEWCGYLNILPPMSLNWHGDCKRKDVR